MILWAAPALGDETKAIIDAMELGALQDSADAAGTDISVRDLLMGIAGGDIALDEASLREIWTGVKDDIIKHTGGIFAAFAAPLVLSAVCRRIVSGKGKSMDLICALCCTAGYLGVMADAIDQARLLLERVSGITDAAFPLVTGFLAVTGAASTQAMLTPMAGVVGMLTTDIMGGWGLYLCTAACACALAAAFGSALRLDGIFSLIKSVVMWGSGILLAFFVGVLAIQGMLGAGYDSAAMRTAQFAVDKMIPVIGGDISDSLETVLASVMLVKTATGVTGMLVVLSVCLGPVLRLWAAYFAIRLAAAATSPVTDGDMTGMVERFSQVIAMLITICLVAMTMSLVLLGAAVSAGRAV